MGQSWEIVPGSDVVDARGDWVGTVVEAAPSYVLVEQGRFFPDDVYVPLGAVAALEPGVVRLAVTGEEALAAGWHVGPPAGVGALSTAPVAPGVALGGHAEGLGTTAADQGGAGGTIRAMEGPSTGGGNEPMGDAHRPADAGPVEPPGSASGEAEAAGRAIPGNVGSLDDVPEGTEGGPVAEEEPPDG
jgi:hypothetical protein